MAEAGRRKEAIAAPCFGMPAFIAQPVCIRAPDLNSTTSFHRQNTRRRVGILWANPMKRWHRGPRVVDDRLRGASIASRRDRFHSKDPHAGGAHRPRKITLQRSPQRGIWSGEFNYAPAIYAGPETRKTVDISRAFSISAIPLCTKTHILAAQRRFEGQLNDRALGEQTAASTRSRQVPSQTFVFVSQLAKARLSPMHTAIELDRHGHNRLLRCAESTQAPLGGQCEV